MSDFGGFGEFGETLHLDDPADFGLRSQNSTRRPGRTDLKEERRDRNPNGNLRGWKR